MAAADALDDEPCVAEPEPDPVPLSGQFSRSRWPGALGVSGVLGAGVVGSVCVGAVVVGASVCAEALNGLSTVSANKALAIPNAVMPVVTTFLIQSPFVGGFTRHHATLRIRRA